MLPQMIKYDKEKSMIDSAKIIYPARLSYKKLSFRRLPFVESDYHVLIEYPECGELNYHVNFIVYQHPNEFHILLTTFDISENDVNWNKTKDFKIIIISGTIDFDFVLNCDVSLDGGEAENWILPELPKRSSGIAKRNAQNQIDYFRISNILSKDSGQILINTFDKRTFENITIMFKEIGWAEIN
jgi:hypothetical protein